MGTVTVCMKTTWVRAQGPASDITVRTGTSRMPKPCCSREPGGYYIWWWFFFTSTVDKSHPHPSPPAPFLLILLLKLSGVWS